jgi:hypothetical protein
MHKVELERLLEKAVADALGVNLVRRRIVLSRSRPVAGAARRRVRAIRELHPA